jgi:hypothetical protein
MPDAVPSRKRLVARSTREQAPANMSRVESGVILRAARRPQPAIVSSVFCVEPVAALKAGIQGFLKLSAMSASTLGAVDANGGYGFTQY